MIWKCKPHHCAPTLQSRPPPWWHFPNFSLKCFLYSSLTPSNTFINDIHNYSLSFSAREQLRAYILTWSYIIICSSKPINQEDLRVTPLSQSVLLIFESLVLISWTSWFLLQGFLPLAPAPEERMRQLEHQSPLRRACFHKMERITNNNSSPETASLLQDSTLKSIYTLTLHPKPLITIFFA